MDWTRDENNGLKALNMKLKYHIPSKIKTSWITRFVIGIGLILIGVMLASATPQITSWSNNATNNSNSYIPINANTVLNLSVIVNESGTYNWFVDDVAVINNQSILNQTYTSFANHYIKAYLNNSNGTSNTITWTVSVKAPLAKVTVAALSNKTQVNLTNAIRTENVKGIVSADVEPYTNIIGNMFYAIIWGLLFATYWIRGGKITIPSTVGVIFGAVIIGTLPTQYVFVSQVLIIGGIFFVIYTFFKR